MGLEVAIHLLMSFFGFILLTFIILSIIRKLSLKYTSPESLNHKSSNSELVPFFGPGQSLLNSYTGVLNVFASRAILNKPLDIFEDGKGIRDFIYIDDAVDATVLAIENEKSSNETFNVGTGVGTTIWDAALSISKCLDKEVVCNITGHYRYGDIRHSLADMGAISKELGFVPKYSFERGLHLFIEWVQSQDVRDESSDLIFNENLNKGVLRINKE